MFREMTLSLQGSILGVVFLMSVAHHHHLAAVRLPEWLTASPAVASEPDRLEALATAKARWKSTGIENYVITVMAFRGFIHTEQHTITVKAGKAVSDNAQCASAAVEVGACVIERRQADRYSVDGLLSDAEEALRQSGEKAVELKYDPVLGIPLEANYRDRGFWIEKFERN